MMLAEAMVPVMNVALVLGCAVVMPRSFSVPLAPWAVSGGLVACSLWLPAGWSAACLLVPWFALTAWQVAVGLRRRSLATVVMGGFGVTAALALIASRLEVTLFGIPEPIVKLTALHFTYAGVASLGLSTGLERSPSWRTWLLIVAPPVVALGFVTRRSVFQVGGALLMTAGVLVLAVSIGRRALSTTGIARALGLVSAASPWVAMALACSWAANQYWPAVPALTVPDMVPTHGALNAFGFALCGHLAAWLEGRAAPATER